MILPPFVEGLIVAVLGIACYIFDAYHPNPSMQHLGDVMIGIGLGYLGNQALVTQPPPK